MPFYEYKNIDKKSCKFCKNGFEVMQSILAKSLQKCPECGARIERVISRPAAVIMRGKQMNQYNDVKHAKYWIDNDGNKWKVGPGDGHSQSPTVSRKRKRSDEQVSFIKKKREQLAKKKRSAQSYKRFLNRIKK